MGIRLLAIAAIAAWSVPAAAAQLFPESDDVEVVGHVLEPVPVRPTAARLARLSVPAGFRLERFADGLVDPRMIAVGGDGTVYVTERATGRLMMLRDRDGDGRAELRQPIASRPGLHGIAIDGRRMYLATVNDVYVADIRADGTVGDLERIIDDLPDGGQHPNRTLAIGPDGQLYISVGSSCNDCAEADPQHAAILVASPDGRERRIFASGLRNTIGFDWQPGTGTLYGLDHGIDWLGDDTPPEELNRIEHGGNYGWPYVYADGRINPALEPPGGIMPEEWARMSEPPVLTYTAHAAPMQMAFYDGAQFPAEYRGDAFAAMRGSWNRRPPSGYEIVRIRFENGRPRSIEPFVTGFLWPQPDGSYAQLGRLAGLTIARDGALLFSDDANGIVYRVSHEAAIAEATDLEARMEPAAGGAMALTVTPPQLARYVVDTRALPSLTVTSGAFAANGRIPRLYSAYGEGISPPLSWSEGPAGTQSYAVLLEDAGPRTSESSPQPFARWLVYNIPASRLSLGEALPPAPRLEWPAGVLQGRNAAGSIGYAGMRPADRPTHRYRFHVFALDRMLDLAPGADRAALLAAIRGHVLAKGDLVARFRRP